MSDPEEFIGYITQYALSRGVVMTELRVEERYDAKYYALRRRGEGFSTSLFSREVNAHRTWESALVKAEDMRAKKIASLEKQIKKLRSLKFEEPKEMVE